ncbi:MAG: YkgJ family cysteine cluster protein [Planctomycetota bacterium]
MGPCQSCHAGCCRTFAVPVSGADIIRIESELGLGFWDFVCRWADAESKIALKYAPHFHFSDEPKTPFVICLAHSASAYFPQTTKCLFLREGSPDEERPLGEARCGIHKSRPSACRAFPTKLSEAGNLAIIRDVPERGRPGDSPIYELCPRPWEPDDFNRLEAVQDLVIAKFEMAVFHSLADLWNQSPRPWSVFPDFLRFVYSSRVMLEAEHQARQLAQNTIKLPDVDKQPKRKVA